MNTLSFNQIQKSLKWKDFHDSGLISISFHFLDEIEFSYKSKIILDIQIIFKNDPEQPKIVRIIFYVVSDVQINTMMDDIHFSESSEIYSLTEKNEEIELITIKGWKLKFKSKVIECIILS